MQSKVVCRSCASASAAVADADDLDVAVAEQRRDALALARVVLDHQHAAQALRELRLEPLQRRRPARSRFTGLSA